MEGMISQALDCDGAFQMKMSFVKFDMFIVITVLN